MVERVNFTAKGDKMGWSREWVFGFRRPAVARDQKRPGEVLSPWFYWLVGLVVGIGQATTGHGWSRPGFCVTGATKARKIIALFHNYP